MARLAGLEMNRSGRSERWAKRRPISGAFSFPRLLSGRSKFLNPGFFQLDFAWRMRTNLFILSHWGPVCAFNPIPLSIYSPVNTCCLKNPMPHNKGIYVRAGRVLCQLQLVKHQTHPPGRSWQVPQTSALVGSPS